MTEPVTVRPPIPVSCAHRPTAGGLVVPVVNTVLADGGADFRSHHQTTYAECWTKCRCQTCGNPTGHVAILLGGPNQLRSGRFDEPPLCVPCTLYASQACPMVAGRQDRYADRGRLTEGRRGHVCPDEHCDCGGWVDSDPTAVDSAGQPAHPWYAAYIRPGGYAVTAHKTITRCSDKGCEHERVLVNGGWLTAPPLKVILVSQPGAGRVWRRLTDTELAGLLPASYDLPEAAHA